MIIEAWYLCANNFLPAFCTPELVFECTYKGAKLGSLLAPIMVKNSIGATLLEGKPYELGPFLGLGCKHQSTPSFARDSLPLVSARTLAAHVNQDLFLARRRRVTEGHGFGLILGPESSLSLPFIVVAVMSRNLVVAGVVTRLAIMEFLLQNLVVGTLFFVVDGRNIIDLYLRCSILNFDLRLAGLIGRARHSLPWDVCTGARRLALTISLSVDRLAR